MSLRIATIICATILMAVSAFAEEYIVFQGNVGVVKMKPASVQGSITVCTNGVKRTFSISTAISEANMESDAKPGCGSSGRPVTVMPRAFQPNVEGVLMNDGSTVSGSGLDGSRIKLNLADVDRIGWITE